MQLVFFSSPDKFMSETPIVNTLFQNGLEIFHLKKPAFSKKKLKKYINGIHPKFHNKIVIHSNYSLVLKFDLKGIHISKRLSKKKIFN